MNLTHTSSTRGRLRGFIEVASLIAVALASPAPLRAQSQFYPEYAQYLGQCSGDTRSVADLEVSIARYHEHTFRLAEKFVTGFYRQTARMPGLRLVRLEQVLRGLEGLAPRRAAVLFYAYAADASNAQRKGKLCIWLISPYIEVAGQAPGSKENFLRAEAAISLEAIESLRANLVNALGVIGLARDVTPLPPATVGEPTGPPDAFGEASRVLLPPGFVRTLEHDGIDTLVVLPIFDVGAIPFAALPTDDHRTLGDIVSVVVAPGFFVFLDPPHDARTTFPNALVVANLDPGKDDLGRALPVLNVQNEANRIAGVLNARVITSDATIKNVVATVKAKPGPSLIYIAAHGRADEVNPLDGGSLALRDGPWTGKQISKLDLMGARPLVVLSACQTGLGKNFEVGNIGLARAWYQAGASNVVMTLWSVYQPATQELMSRFVRLLSECPPDKALRAAMLRAKKEGMGPARWAGFAVFGLPDRPSTAAWRDPAHCGERTP